MHTELTLRRSLINAALALGLLGLAALGVVKVAGRHWQWQDTVRVRAEFATVAGLAAT